MSERTAATVTARWCIVSFLDRIQKTQSVNDNLNENDYQYYFDCEWGSWNVRFTNSLLDFRPGTALAVVDSIERFPCEGRGATQGKYCRSRADWRKSVDNVDDRPGMRASAWKYKETSA